jgi:hypothetical protein
MRYYRIDITDPATGKIIKPQGAAPGQNYSWSSLTPAGRANPAAQNVQIDVPIAAYGTPRQGAYLRVWGISLQDISQAFDINGLNVALYGGFSPGLPLATAASAYAGLLVRGSIFQAFGNWVGTDQTLDLVLLPPTGSPAAPLNIVLNWKAGTPLAPALNTTLAVAFPNLKRNISISPNLILPHDQPGYYHSLAEFAQVLEGITAPILGGDYAGVQITISDTTINAFDFTQPAPPPLQIAFTDLIGQPTWLDLNTINFKTVMRADLQVGQQIKMPQTPVIQQASSFQRFRDKSTFTGTFVIRELHHFGNFRQPDAASWNTTVDAVSLS